MALPTATSRVLPPAPHPTPCCGRCGPRVSWPAHRVNQRAAAPTRAAWRTRGGAGHRWRSQLDDAPAPAVTPGSAQHPGTKLLSDPSTASRGRKEALSSPSQTRQASPDKPLSSEPGCGAGDRQGPHLEANKASCKCPQRAVSNVYAIPLSFLSRAERVEVGSQVSPPEHGDSRRCEHI